MIRGVCYYTKMSIKNGDVVCHTPTRFDVYSDSDFGRWINECRAPGPDGYETVIPLLRNDLVQRLKNFLKTNDHQVESILFAIEREPKKFLEATGTNITMIVDSFQVGKPQKDVVLPMTPKELMARKEICDKEIERVNAAIEESWNGKFALAYVPSERVRRRFEEFGWKIVMITGGGEGRYQFWPKEK